MFLAGMISADGQYAGAGPALGQGVSCRAIFPLDGKERRIFVSI